ncbi:hypothetical protein WG68_13670 [Arsukibacterium ikkense]|uniref:Secreted protein n=1 Tax=Arsukibacterium ikkense TaxID=336831 RepID=A0A0M2V1Y6_9GAMM|nr:hypothetical protein [Arsukibacterium ikkense]KKO44872.1 hypothetical protein WG68_13670 [Arsukibacterium ikkense]
MNIKRCLLAATLLTTPSLLFAAEPASAEFWQNLAQHCGQAYAGKRVIARDDRPDMLQGDETLVVHFRHCSDKLLALPFHIGNTDGSWDRSRTWRFTRQSAQLELRHDHRLANGEPDQSNTMYGGVSIGDGSANQQRFLFTERKSGAGEDLGWQIEIVPGERYTYGTFMGDRWSWRVDFDLTKPLAELPPAPWGFESE